jgi:hypothetical protein
MFLQKSVGSVLWIYYVEYTEKCAFFLNGKVIASFLKQFYTYLSSIRFKNGPAASDVVYILVGHVYFFEGLYCLKCGLHWVYISYKYKNLGTQFKTLNF